MVVPPSFDITQIEIVDGDICCRVRELLCKYPKTLAALGPVFVAPELVLLAETADTSS